MDLIVHVGGLLVILRERVDEVFVDTNNLLHNLESFPDTTTPLARSPVGSREVTVVPTTF